MNEWIRSPSLQRCCIHGGMQPNSPDCSGWIRLEWIQYCNSLPFQPLPPSLHRKQMHRIAQDALAPVLQSPTISASCSGCVHDSYSVQYCNPLPFQPLPPSLQRYYVLVLSVCNQSATKQRSHLEMVGNPNRDSEVSSEKLSESIGNETTEPPRNGRESQ